MADLLEKLKLEGKLRGQKVGFVQIEGFLKEALKDINEAKREIEIGERGPFLLAYQAMLKAGRSLLFLQNLQPADGAQHRTVIQVCEFFSARPSKIWPNNLRICAASAINSSMNREAYFLIRRFGHL